MKAGTSGNENFKWTDGMTPEELRVFIKSLGEAAKAARLKRDPTLDIQSDDEKENESTDDSPDMVS